MSPALILVALALGFDQTRVGMPCRFRKVLVISQHVSGATRYWYSRVTDPAIRQRWIRALDRG